MHELGLCSSILAAVEARADGRPVSRVKVRVGRLHHVHPEAFGQSFAIAAYGTVAEEATAELEIPPLRACCGSCGAAWEAAEIPLACPACGGVGIDIRGGDELTLESIEYRG